MVLIKKCHNCIGGIVTVGKERQAKGKCYYCGGTGYRNAPPMYTIEHRDKVIRL